MLHYKADPLLLRYNILKYKLSLSISLMLLVSKTLAFVKSTLRSQITTHEASLPWSQVTFPTIRLSSYWGANVFTKKAALALTLVRAMHLQDVTRWIFLGGQKESTWNTWINCCVHGLSSHLRKQREWFVSTLEHIHLLHDRKSTSLLSTKLEVQ